MTTVALVDDHVLLRNSLANIISTFSGYSVLFQADNGKDFIDQVNPAHAPDIVLLDISMPVMDGFETAAWIKKNLPDTKVLILSMMDNETTVIRMIHAGVSGFILKDSRPNILLEAFDCIKNHGFYTNDLISNSMLHFVTKSPDSTSLKSYQLSDREMEFIRHACTDMTYKEIASKMSTSPRNIDLYRDQVYSKLDVKSRVGLILFAIREGLILV